MKKSILFLLLCAVMPLMSNAATYLKGDVDGDGSVGISDVTRLVDYLLAPSIRLINASNTEVSGDGRITIEDVTCLIDYLLNGSWPPPEPGPATQEFTVNGVTFTMVTVEGGTFQMGATAEQGTTAPLDDEYPVHEVTLSTYCIGQTEVTQELWEAVMSMRDTTSYWWRDPEHLLHPSHFSAYNGFEENLQRPVESATPEEIQEFIYTLRCLTGVRFRLPTEAEWEFAARGGNLSKGYKYAGSNDLNEVAWYKVNARDVGVDSPDYGTHSVATKAPNELGLYDMSGNVLERCEDMYASYPIDPQYNPIVYHHGNGSTVARGGSYWEYELCQRVSCRARFPIYGSDNAGFRLAIGDAIVAAYEYPWIIK